MTRSSIAWIAALGALCARPVAVEASGYAATALRSHGSTGDVTTKVASAGDVNGDGVWDYLVGEIKDSGNRVGRVSVYSGATGALLRTLKSNQKGDYFGAGLAGIGDINGDGRSDIAVGAPRYVNGNPPAHVYLYSGQTGALLRRLDGSMQPPTPPFQFGGSGPQVFVPSDGFGLSMAAVGDTNGDGVGDLLIAAPYTNPINPTQGPGDLGGKAYLYSGSTGALIRAHEDLTDYCLNDTGGFRCAWRGFLGWSVSPAGDRDGDGRADYAIGVPGEFDPPVSTDFRERGRVHIYSGATGALLEKIALPIVDHRVMYGTAVAGPADMNHNGHSDLIIAGSAPIYPTDLGAIGTYDPVTGATALAASVDITHLEGTHDGFGEPSPDSYEHHIALDVLGDVDGDGVSELVVADKSHDAGWGPWRGKVSILNGATGAVELVVEGPAADSVFGVSVAALGDVNGDGSLEFAVSQRLPGAVYVYSVVANNCMDADGDGYGSFGDPSCPVPGQVDCNDGDALVHPGAAESCSNGVDDDCDGAMDAADSECGAASCVDADGDGYGAFGDSSCLVPNVIDCDDSNSQVNPGRREKRNNGIDDDCDGLVDER